METSEAVGTVAAVLIAIALAATLAGWALMIAIGVLFAHGVIPATLGFGPSVAVAVLLNFALGGSGAATRTSK